MSEDREPPIWMCFDTRPKPPSCRCRACDAWWRHLRRWGQHPTPHK